MASLLDSEIAQVKREVLDHLLSVGALPYVDIKYVYQLIQDNVVDSGTAATSSSTTVSTAGPTVLTLGSVSGLSAGVPVIVDVDGSRERCTVRAVSGLTISVICELTHSGTYPVEIQSPLTLVRGILSDLSRVDKLLSKARSGAGLKKVDEVEWFSPSDGITRLGELRVEQKRMRRELAMACGILNVLLNHSSGSSLVPY